jgi:hypothetical protein
MKPGQIVYEEPDEWQDWDEETWQKAEKDIGIFCDPFVVLLTAGNKPGFIRLDQDHLEEDKNETSAVWFGRVSWLHPTVEEAVRSRIKKDRQYIADLTAACDRAEKILHSAKTAPSRAETC